MNEPQASDQGPAFPIDGPERQRGEPARRGSDVESEGASTRDEIDPDSPASTLFEEGEDAVEPNEPG